MNEPILPRVQKPRVSRQLVLVHKHKWYDRDLAGRRGVPIYAKRFVCFDNNVAAIGCTIQGAYKNWVSLKLDYLHMMNRLAMRIRGTTTSEYDVAQLGSDMDYRCG